MNVQIDELEVFFTLLLRVIDDATAKQDQVMLGRADGMMRAPEFLSLPERKQQAAMEAFAAADWVVKYPMMAG